MSHSHRQTDCVAADRPQTDGPVHTRYAAAGRQLLLFFAISFLGWLIETVFCWFLFGEYTDRGFLHLPFCTIYGFTVTAIYLLIGTPKRGGILLRRCESRAVRYVAYFLLAALIPTLAELITGLVFDKLFGMILWEYNSYRFNLWGYICLEMTLTWGVVITVFMGTVFPLIQRLVHRIPQKVAGILSLLLTAAVCVDWLICFCNL